MKIHRFLFFVLVFCFVIFPFDSYSQSYREIRGVENKVKIPAKIETVRHGTEKSYDTWRDLNEGVSFSFNSTITYSDYHKKVYISSHTKYKIFMFDEDLNYLGVLGRYGQGEGEYTMPAELDVDSRGWFSLIDVGFKRITLYDDKFSVVKMLFSVPKSSSISYIGGSSTVRAYLVPDAFIVFDPSANSDFLFNVYNISNNSQYSFGEQLPILEERFKIHQSGFNRLFFEMDKTNTIYCAFYSHTILRKYSLQGELLCEADYSSIKDVKKFVESKEKRVKKQYEESLKNDPNNNGRLFVSPEIASDIAVDDNYVYLLVKDGTISWLYVFDKSDFAFKKKYVSFGINNFDARHPQYIYAITPEGAVKIKK